MSVKRRIEKLILPPGPPWPLSGQTSSVRWSGHIILMSIFFIIALREALRTQRWNLERTAPEKDEINRWGILRYESRNNPKAPPMRAKDPPQPKFP